MDRIGRRLARKLNRPTSGYQPYTPSDFPTLCRVLRPGDVLLVEARERFSVAIQYLMQSTWSHAAICVGDALPAPVGGSERRRLVEVNLGEAGRVVAFMIARIGLRYDHCNIFDLLRYFVPTPPVPVRWRRRMIAFGAGVPTRAICSSLIAQAFQSIRYPILPEISQQMDGPAKRELMHIRHHALFTPRDFDLSPYFQLVKPHLVEGFDHRRLKRGDLLIAGQGSPEPLAGPSHR